MNYIIKTCLTIILVVVIICLLIILIMSGVDSCTDTIWNEGICSNCEVRYELKGVSKGLKYYVCSECGQEIQRFFDK